jgi:UDP-N-acetylmuramoyl-L-alanyl-D-glutamate--2,6-diaminopimelate ligase
MEDYIAAKRLLLEAGRAGAAVSVINVDDPYGRRLAKEFGHASTVGIDSGDLRATDLRPDSSGTTFMLDGIELRTPLPGRFNVVNSLCAVAAARALGVDDATIGVALGGATVAPGRFQPVDEGQDFTVLVDYAHTPDSLDRVLQAAKELTGGRLIAVFGAGGDRDRSKRPLMGEAAARHADLAIVTSDNPRNENPETIIAAIIGGMGLPAAGKRIEPIIDRRTAIEAAIAQAGDADVVVIAGKGHEQGQEFAGGEKLPFDDVSVAREVLRARLAS